MPNIISGKVFTITIYIIFGHERLKISARIPCKTSGLTVLEKELLMNIRHLERDDMRRLLAQARSLVEFGYEDQY